MQTTKMDKATKQAWQGWVNFSKATAYVIIGSTVLLAFLAVIIV